ncbi:MAG TPA: TonB-dependent receptor, partial [Bryobacteraceae bacterium]|nr:TonB-dependent receptor [Bryobacteraceae bacterium]
MRLKEILAARIVYFWRDTQYQYNANATCIKGPHNVRFGLDIAPPHMNHTTAELGSSPCGQFDFTGGTAAIRGGASPNQFNSFAGFLLGLPTAVGTAAPMESSITTRDWSRGFYVRDQWQATRKLTLTIGVRHENYPMPTRADRGVELYDPETNLMLIRGVDSVPTDLGVDMKSMFLRPRVGLAYRLGNNWLFRSGFGINMDPYPLAGRLRTNYTILIPRAPPVQIRFSPSAESRKARLAFQR